MRDKGREREGEDELTKGVEIMKAKKNAFVVFGSV